jgi:acetyltransferase-like isoleucine patch superfamily enzyme
MFPWVWALKGNVLRLLCPLFFRRIGVGCRFAGRIRLPMPFRNVTLGNECIIGESVFFQTGRESSIRIGNNCSFNSGCHIVASAAIEIGDNVAVGEYVSIRDQEHNFNPDTGVRGAGFRVASIRIESNVWIGRGVYIGPGSVIASGSIVGANSVVRGVFPRNVLIAGAPAKIRKVIAE